jgi:putative transposase
MKLIAQVKLIVTPEQADALKRTLRLTNTACDYISSSAWQAEVFRQYDLHKVVYQDTRATFTPLTSQMVVRCIARVADSYKIDRETKRTFKPLSAIPYDDRILRWYVDQSTVSIWTVDGRRHIPFVCGERQRELLKARRGESDLVLRKGKFYLFATCNVDEPTPDEFGEALGVDFGIVNIATDSDGQVYSGAQINGLRARHRRLRAKLQGKGTKSARRLLKQRRQKEQRFAQQENHRISKALVAKAKDTKRAIAVEDLSGIRTRTTVCKAQRATHSSWSFFDLRSKIEYKARRAGVTVLAVDPRNTSRTCPACGYSDKANRKTQSTFSCVSCGHSGLADHIAAVNIGRVAVNRPYVSDVQTSARCQG